ncbi:peptide-binding protein [bacterium]|nr:peptide-binding protein [bacterium]
MKLTQSKPWALGLLAIGVIFAGLVFQACAKKTSGPKNTLNLRLSGEPNLLNPILTTDAYSGTVTGVIFSGLLRANEQLELEPDLAESYTISPDGKTYTFKLRKNIKWHDGHPFTSEDVVFTFNTIMDPKTNTVRRSNYVINGKPILFSAPDPYTVKAQLPEPFSPFLLAAAMEIIPKHLLDTADINTATFNRHPIGTGPFKFKEWKTNQYILTERNENYYGTKPKLERIIFKPIPNYNAAKIAMTKGDIDAFDVNPHDLEQIKKMNHVQVYDYDELLYSYAGFNLKNPHLQDLRVRQAFAYAIDRDQLVKVVLKGYGTVAHIPNSPVSWSYPEPSAITQYKYDPAKAISLLENAGYKKNSTGIFEKNGKALSFTLIFGQGGKTGAQNAEIMQDYLKKVGIELKIQPLEWQSFLKIINSGKDPKNFDICMLSWSLGLDPDGYSLWHSAEYPKGFNFIGYANPKVDQLLVAGRRESDRRRRKAIYSEVYPIIGQELPYLFLYYPRTTTAVNKRVRGLAKPGPAGLFVRIESVYVE